MTAQLETDAGDASPARTSRLLPIRQRRTAAVFSVGLVALVMSPIFRNCVEEPEDGFPLSHFPMFSKRRGQELEVTHFAGLEADGTRKIVPFRYMGGVSGLNTGRKQIMRLVSEGSSGKLCERVARNVAASPDPELASIARVRVVTGHYAYASFFAGEIAPSREVTHAECAVAR